METKYDLKTLATDWEALFLDLMEKKKTHPLVPYQPTPAYVYKAPYAGLVKLNIAAGTSIFPYQGWKNFDFADFDHYFNFIKTVQTDNGMPDHQKKLWQFARDGGEINYVKHDMTQPFTMIDDNTTDFIYLGQCIEHLHFHNQAPKVIKECFRMLKPGGIIRLTTPDLNKLLSAYNKDEMSLFADEQPAFYKDLPKEAQLPLVMFGASGDQCLQNHYEGHFFCYSERTMTDLLTQAGFKDVEYTYPKCGKNKEIAMEVEDFGFSHSLIVEAIK